MIYNDSPESLPEIEPGRLLGIRLKLFFGRRNAILKYTAFWIEHLGEGMDHNYIKWVPIQALLVCRIPKRYSFEERIADLIKSQLGSRSPNISTIMILN